MSLRLVEETLLERGIAVSYETIRRWGIKFGLNYARCLPRKQPGRSDVWHMDEVLITIAGRKHWLWRAVDQDVKFSTKLPRAAAMQRLPGGCWRDC